jgi:methylglutaconyl-CoA hydratase
VATGESVRMIQGGGIARLTLDRPDKRNALDRATILELTAALERCGRDPDVRVVLLTGAGGTFCAGADLAEMQSQRSAPEEANRADAERLAALLGTLNALPKPTLARVNGDGYGGALGLLGACDIVVACANAKFAFTEVRLGIIPAVISPFVVAKMGAGAARRYMLSAETITAEQLRALGLVHEVTSAEDLDPACERLLAALLRGAPGAQAEAKRLIADVAASPRDPAATSREMAQRLAALRVLPEAQEGFEAFFAKRKPKWISGS